MVLVPGVHKYYLRVINDIKGERDVVLTFSYAIFPGPLVASSIMSAKSLITSSSHSIRGVNVKMTRGAVPTSLHRIRVLQSVVTGQVVDRDV
jgi:hypothetical protein